MCIMATHYQNSQYLGKTCGHISWYLSNAGSLKLWLDWYLIINVLLFSLYEAQWPNLNDHNLGFNFQLWILFITNTESTIIPFGNGGINYFSAFT